MTEGAKPAVELAAPALLLCRTPFQARVLLEIVRPGTVYDVVYVTSHGSAEDVNYFDLISQGARQAAYLGMAAGRRTFPHNLGIIRRVPAWAWQSRYETILLASVDSPAFRRVALKHPEAAIATFDDGAESLLPDPFLLRGGQPWRDELYGRLLGGGTVRTLRKHIGRHFTVFDTLQNVLPQEQVVAISLHSSSPPSGEREGTKKTFFIGQPFAEIYSEAQIRRLREFAAKQSPDYYVGHPREREPLLADVPMLDKKGLIAEDAILQAAPGGRATIIAAFSTVLFTLPASGIEKIYLNVTDAVAAPEWARLAAIARCRCVDV